MYPQCTRQYSCSHKMPVDRGEFLEMLQEQIGVGLGSAISVLTMFLTLHMTTPFTRKSYMEGKRKMTVLMYLTLQHYFEEATSLSSMPTPMRYELEIISNSNCLHNSIFCTNSFT